MKRKIPENEEEIISDEEGSNIIALKVLEGGRIAKAGWEPPDSIWLNDLPIGAIFLAGDKHSADYDLLQFEVIGKSSKTVTLKMDVNKQTIERKVVPVRFCQKHFLHEIIGIIGYEE